MMSLKSLLERAEPHFTPGGRYQKWYPLYEAFATLMFTPGTVTRSAAHVRDGVDLKRIMIMVWLAVFPALFWGLYNVGNQTVMALGHQDAAALSALIEGETDVDGFLIHTEFSEFLFFYFFPAEPFFFRFGFVVSHRYFLRSI